MTPFELAITAGPTVVSVVGSALTLAYKLGKQDKAIEYIARLSERQERRSTGSDPPPREKLATIPEQR